jgi:hypothetical protein
VPRCLAQQAALLLLAGTLGAGCGLFSTDEASLPGVYELEAFRVQRAGGEVEDVGSAGATLEMTLTEDGRVVEGQFTAGDSAPAEIFTGTYTRDGDRVTFDFDAGVLLADFGTGTPLAQVEWIFYDEKDDPLLGADADAYVLFLERTGDGPEAPAAE